MLSCYKNDGSSAAPATAIGGVIASVAASVAVGRVESVAGIGQSSMRGGGETGHQGGGHAGLPVGLTGLRVCCSERERRGGDQCELVLHGHGFVDWFHE